MEAHNCHHVKSDQAFIKKEKSLKDTLKQSFK